MTLPGLAQRTATLLVRFGPIAFAEFLALTLGISAIQMLMAPEAFRADAMGDVSNSAIAIYADPLHLLNEAAYAFVVGGLCLRIWWATSTEAGRDGDALRSQAVPLVILNLLAGFVFLYALYLSLFLAFLVAALSTTLVPVVLIERAGWASLLRTLAQCGRQFWRLTVAWSVVLLLWIVLLLALRADPVALQDADLGAIWQAELPSTIMSAVMTAIALCLTMAAYELMVDDEAGGPRNLMDVFR